MERGGGGEVLAENRNKLTWGAVVVAAGVEEREKPPRAGVAVVVMAGPPRLNPGVVRL